MQSIIILFLFCVGVKEVLRKVVALKGKDLEHCWGGRGGEVREKCVEGFGEEI